VFGAFMEREMVHYGSFYPANNLEKVIKTFLNAKKVLDPVVLIVPHAGYYYSGFTAGKAYAQIIDFVDNNDKVFENIFIIGPSHYEYIDQPVVSSFDAFETPLGHLQVNMNIIKDLTKKGICVENDLAHAKEHSIEVQLPFISYIYKDAKKIPKIVPILLNDENKKLSKYLEGFTKSSLIVVSSDLSHYLNAKDAKKKDKQTIDVILGLNLNDCWKIDACGNAGIKTAINLAKSQDLKPILLDYVHSGYITKDTKSVVGYTAIGFKM